jgi:hypothetical protein
MAFTKIPPRVLSLNLSLPQGSVFDSEQEDYLKRLLLDIEKALEEVYEEGQKVASSDQNPQREVIDLDGKTGSLRIDLGLSQLSQGVPVAIYASSLGGTVSIAGFDNAYNWTMVHIVNRDPTNDIIVEQNAEISIAATTSLGENGAMTLMQVENAPVWVEINSYVSSA